MNNHRYDVVAGAVIGTATALVAFRQTFASVWDFRFNHIPLPRTSSLFLRRGIQSSSGAVPHAGFAADGPFFTYRWQPAGAVLPSWSLPMTREGGWGTLDEEHVGAPFDATAMGLGGLGGGRGGGFRGGVGNTTGGGALGRAEAQAS